MAGNARHHRVLPGRHRPVGAGPQVLSASASAKAINWCTNLASIIYFGSTGQLLYGIGLAMAASNVLGATLGSHLAIRKGSKFVRIFFLIIVAGLIAKLAQTIWTG